MATTTALVLKGDFFRAQGQQFSGTATGGSAAKLTDTALKNLANDIWPDSFKGKQVRITSGSASGDLRLCTAEDRTQGDLFPQADFSAAIANTNTYEVWGNAIHGGTTLTNLFNDVLRKLHPITKTRLSVVGQQNVYAFTSSVDSPEDILRVWQHLLNYDVGGDYTPSIVWGWQPFRLDGAGTPTVQLQLPYAVTPTSTTLLNGAINDAVTTITVDSTAAGTNSSPPAFPSSGRLVIDTELIDYTGTTATTFTGCSRGVGQSTAASHSNDARVDIAAGTTYYVEHRTSFTAFSADTSTIDAIYRDWICWETVLRFAWDKWQSGPQSDRSRWKALMERAADELMPLRARFDPTEPILIRPQRYA